jgi:hypothetical protein
MCSAIYPPTVRATGFNLAHNMAMSWLGGVSPTIVTAIAMATGRSAVVASGVLIAVSAVVSAIASVGLIFYAPQANGVGWQLGRRRDGDRRSADEEAS